jgi:hypothetical protein
MKELKELEELIVAEVSAKRGYDVSTMDPSVVGLTIGTLYGIILNNPKALRELEGTIQLRKANA